MNKETLRGWIIAIRLRTLPLSLSGIIIGSALSYANKNLNIVVLILTFLTALLLQILSNVANDYGDSVWGADNSSRRGPQRATQMGLISHRKIKLGIIFLVLLSLISGITLILAAGDFHFNAFSFYKIYLPFLILGLLAIAAAILYTNGKKPYGYVGLGDIFVFIFFGIIGVAGTYYLHNKNINVDILLPSIAVGLLSVSVLNLNNIRDMESDVAAHKYSIPVRLGRIKALIYHYILLFLPFILMSIFFAFRTYSILSYIFILSLPLFISNALSVKKYSEPNLLDPLMKKLSLSILLFVLLCSISIVLSV